MWATVTAIVPVMNTLQSLPQEQGEQGRW